MAGSENSIDSKIDVGDKNTEIVYCTYCPSKILTPGAATFINIDFSLPHILRKCDEDKDSKESINSYWLVEDINSFENISVSHKVENVKYLACADCERGPVGWHDLSTFRSYIALSRVRHQIVDCDKNANE